MPPDQPVIRAEPDAVEFVRQHGGRLYVWADSAGLEHVATAPKDGVQFDKIDADGFEFFQDTTIDSPQEWAVLLHPFPRRHLSVQWNGRSWAAMAFAAP